MSSLPPGLSTRRYSRNVVARSVTCRSASAREMMHYYWETMDACVPPAAVLSALRRAGLVEVKRNAVLGLFSEYSAVKA